jgi:predicted nucleic acid-binding protein
VWCAAARPATRSIGDTAVIAVDSSVLVEILIGAPQADAAETTLREALSKGPVVVCDVVVAEVCSSLREGDQAMQVLEDMGVSFREVECKAAIRAGEMQRRYRARGGTRLRTVPDFIVGAHALLQCNALITRDPGFFRDYFKGLKLIVPKAA